LHFLLTWATLPRPYPLLPQGQWADNAYNGRGTYTYSNNQSYVGEWRNGIREGVGVMTWPDGAVYGECARACEAARLRGCEAGAALLGAVSLAHRLTD